MKLKKPKYILSATMEELEAEPLPQLISCVRCGRILTDPESVKKGIGPECERKFVEEGETDHDA